MANPTGPDSARFRTKLDHGQTVEADGSLITDPATGTPTPAIVVRMSRARAHTLAHVLDDWCRGAAVFSTLNSTEHTERALAWALGAAAAGDPGANGLSPVRRANSARCGDG